MSTLKILGIDPGMRNLGYGVICFNEENNEITIERCGILKVPMKFKGNDALLYMKNEVETLFNIELFSDINKCVVEVPRASFGAIQAWALIPVGVVAGFCMSHFETEDIVLCSPSEWNKAKKKEKTHALLQKELGDKSTWKYHIEPKNEKHKEHILDAIGIAYWHLKQEYIGN